MPFFKIRSRTSVRMMIKSESVPDIIEKAISKLNLSESIDYKLVLENDGTEFDDDDILLEYAKQSSETLVFIILPKDSEWKNNTVNENIDPNIYPSRSMTQGSISDHEVNVPSKSATKILDLEEIIWKKIPNRIFQICKNEESLNPRDRREIIHSIKNYMMDSKNTTRSLAASFAKKLCEAFPKTFCDKIGNNKVETNDDVWSDGQATLITQIYNSVKYEENSKSNKRKKIIQRDSDDEELEIRENEKIIATKWDEYGCVEYAPDLPVSETSTTQEEKRIRLKELFESHEKNETEINKLMKETYCSLRASINELTRKLNDLVIDWPFITNPICFIDHASRLLGKNVAETWNESLKAKAKFIRLYFKVSQNFKEDELKAKIKEIIEGSTKVIDVHKSKLHKTIVIFPLLAAFLKEDIDALLKVVKEDEAVENEYPILIIKGKSFYDETSTFIVAINKEVKLNCSDFLQAMLVTFLSFYVFGLKYNPKVEKTLEFIQRCFLKINPSVGSKKNKSKKRQRKNYDNAVFHLAKELSKFSDEFNFN